MHIISSTVRRFRWVQSEINKNCTLKKTNNSKNTYFYKHNDVIRPGLELPRKGRKIILESNLDEFREAQIISLCSLEHRQTCKSSFGRAEENFKRWFFGVNREFIDFDKCSRISRFRNPSNNETIYWSSALLTPWRRIRTACGGTISNVPYVEVNERGDCQLGAVIDQVDDYYVEIGHI